MIVKLPFVGLMLNIKVTDRGSVSQCNITASVRENENYSLLQNAIYTADYEILNLV